MFNKKNILIKTASVLSLGVLLMAVQKCPQTPGADVRTLKKNIKVVGIQASSFMDTSGFNFSEVARNQLSGVLFDTNYFFERNIYPTSQSSVSKSISGKIQKASFNDQTIQQLKTWFPSAKTSDFELTQESSCLISRPQHFIAGEINSLESYSGASMQFGFNSSVQIPISANFKMDSMRLDLSMHAFDPWTQQNMASVNSKALKNDYSAGFGIDLGIVHLGPEFYRTTGISEVILKGLTNAVTDIAKLLNSLQRQEWQTRVMYSRDNYVAIVGGAELGLKKGDRLKVENEVHDWIGEPCGQSGILAGSAVVTSTPWIIEIEDAGNLISVAKVLNVDENQSINVGALVRIDKLIADLPAATTPANK
jgi:hypothetical protein